MKKLIALRTAWLKTWGHGRFTDTVGITEIPDNAFAGCTNLHYDLSRRWSRLFAAIHSFRK